MVGSPSPFMNCSSHIPVLEHSPDTHLVLDRGEKIELLVDKTENLQFQADHCFQRAKINSKRSRSGFSPWFVTWKKVVNGGEPRLRGCVGTLEARSIITGFQNYALTSALRDRRFPPIQAKELPALECTVSILTDYETASHYLDWEVGKHGLIIEFTDPNNNARRSATYLPEVAAHEGWTREEAIDSLMRKAGYSCHITESLRKSIRVTRYQSTLFTLTYSDYVSYVRETRGAAPTINGVKHVNH
ncbi:AMMECR1-like protein [Salix purpurea]|uniref:AMMECR1-like protein n=1 Tax=Salix purpurea TaxID=77065 RepID=A0A9Q0UCB8_SALPP|nr:AMMECR1-like protein [Salix purpurea]